MKKLRTTLFVCLTALAVLTAFGCKQEAAVGDDVKAWKYQDEINEVGTLQIVVDKNGPVEWAVVVDEYNRVVADAPIKADTPISKAAVDIPQGSAVQFKDIPAGKYTVYVYQPEVKLKVDGKEDTAANLERDLRGTVTIKSGKGVSVKISNYAQHVPQVGLVEIVNNELPKDNTWRGNYGVKTVKAVQQDKDDPNKWIEVSGYTVTAPGDEYLVKQAVSSTEPTKQKILFPAGTYYIAVNQPDRLRDTDESVIISYLKENWINEDGSPKQNPMFPGYVEGKPAEQNVEAYQEYQKNAFWVSYSESSDKRQTITAHEGTATLNTKELGGYLNGDKVAAGKYAAPAVYEIVEALPGEK